MFAAADNAHMARALQLAAQGLYTAHPNPMVGCVLVKDGEVVGEGWHARAGEDHAEIVALGAAGQRARGAVAYVSLEPCAHHGKTPPCAEALAAAGVSKVIAAMEDPFHEVSGRGLEWLRDAGIETAVGLLQDAALELNAGFVSRVTRKRPLLRLKIAASLDGAIAMQSGESQWITGPKARADVQRLRARSGAILTGIGTVLADDPSLTVRHAGIETGGCQPLRVVLDRNRRMPSTARMLSLDGTTLVCHASGDAAALDGAELLEVEAGDGGLDLVAVLTELARREINDLLVEAGPTLAGRLLQQGLVDELVIYQSPHIMGSETRGMFSTPSWSALADRKTLDVRDVRRVGPDTRITARVSN